MRTRGHWQRRLNALMPSSQFTIHFHQFSLKRDFNSPMFLLSRCLNCLVPRSAQFRSPSTAQCDGAGTYDDEETPTTLQSWLLEWRKGQDHRHDARAAAPVIAFFRLSEAQRIKRQQIKQRDAQRIAYTAKRMAVQRAARAADRALEDAWQLADREAGPLDLLALLLPVLLLPQFNAPGIAL
jgi:hypothetical protein